jgi:hypothetical protein
VKAFLILSGRDKLHGNCDCNLLSLWNMSGEILERKKECFSPELLACKIYCTALVSLSKLVSSKNEPTCWIFCSLLLDILEVANFISNNWSNTIYYFVLFLHEAPSLSNCFQLLWRHEQWQIRFSLPSKDDFFRWFS